MRKTITARQLYAADDVIEYPRIALDSEGTIVSIDAGERTADQTILTSSFLDIHIHGSVGHDVMQATPSQFGEMERFLASRGVGHYLPTTVTAPIDETLQALDRIASHIDSGQTAEGCATAIGIHLEGPFISHVKRGVHPPEDILKPDIALFDRFQEAARGHIRLMTVAPETAGAIESDRARNGTRSACEPRPHGRNGNRERTLLSRTARPARPTSSTRCARCTTASRG